MGPPLIERPRLPEVWPRPPSGRVLVLAPHPDDEICGVGGALALHALQKDPITVVFLTDGAGGDPKGRHGGSHSVARTRRTEAFEAAAKLGGGFALRFFGLPDGHEVNDGDLSAVGHRIADVMGEVKPDLVYVPWIGESHADHRNTRLAFDRALARPSPPPAWLLEYEVWSPLPADAILDISDVIELKRAAIQAHESQVAYTDYVHHILGLNAHRALYLPHGRTHGEAFRIARRP